MAELGSVVATFGDLLDAANFGPKKLRLTDQNAQQRNKCRLRWENFSSARFWSASHTLVAVYICLTLNLTSADVLGAILATRREKRSWWCQRRWARVKARG
jgi:hypothetical protein